LRGGRVLAEAKPDYFPGSSSKHYLYDLNLIIDKVITI
jgi:hypothetical protein